MSSYGTDNGFSILVAFQVVQLRQCTLQKVYENRRAVHHPITVKYERLWNIDCTSSVQK